MFINYSEGDKRLIKPCWVAVTSTFPSSPSPRSAWGSAFPVTAGPPWLSVGVSEPRGHLRGCPTSAALGGFARAGRTPKADHRREMRTRPWLSRNGAGDVSRWHYFFCHRSCWFPPRL